MKLVSFIEFETFARNVRDSGYYDVNVKTLVLRDNSLNTHSCQMTLPIQDISTELAPTMLTTMVEKYNEMGMNITESDIYLPDYLTT